MVNRRGAQSRSELLAHAVELFGTKRYEQVSLAEISQRSGAAPALINYHFGTKRALYLAAVQSSFDQLWAELKGLRGEVHERLDRGLDLLLDRAEKHPVIFTVLTSNASDEDIAAISERIHGELFDAFVLETTGGRRTPLLDAALVGGIASAQGLITHWVRYHGIERSQVRQLITAAFQTLLLTALTADPRIRLSSRMVHSLLATTDQATESTAERTS